MTFVTRCARCCLPFFLCIWPLYSIFSAVHYRLYNNLRDDVSSLDNKFEIYLRHPKSEQMPEVLHSSVDDEGTQMRQSFIKAFPSRKKEISLTFTDDVQARMASPYKSREDHEFVMNLFRSIISCPSLYRIGKDSASHWMCGIHTFLKTKQRCQVYVFNQNLTDVTFEEGILKETSCTVHVFDPFLVEQDKERRRQMHPRLRFHDFTVGLAKDTRYLFDELETELKSVEEKNLPQITAMLNHTWIDVLKMDYDGETYTKLAEILFNWKKLNEITGRKLSFPVGQVLFRLSTGGNALQIARAAVSLMNMGLAVFHTEMDFQTEHPWENVAFSLLNLKDQRTFNETGGA